MKIFIVGAHGFIGKHLTEKLSTNSDLTLFTPSSHELDLVNEAAVDEYIAETAPDIIINCANRGGDRNSGNDNIMEENLRIFFNLAKHEKNVRKIINLGSGAEYSKHKPIVDAKEEDADIMMPLDEYGFYKSVVSKYIQKSDRIYNLRIFGAYGEYEDYRFKFITNAIVKNLLHLPIVINKNVYFDYIYIVDLVRIIEYFIYHTVKEKIFNATTGKKIELVALAKIINEISDYESPIEVLHEGLNNEYTSNNEKLLLELENFEFHRHDEAITKLYTYFKERIDSLDKETVMHDPYVKKIDSMWTKDNK